MSFSLLTIHIPKHTSASANTFLISAIFSPKNIAESITPKIGVKKINTETEPTLLYFKSKDQSVKATEDSLFSEGT